MSVTCVLLRSVCFLNASVRVCLKRRPDALFHAFRTMRPASLPRKGALMVPLFFRSNAASWHARRGPVSHSACLGGRSSWRLCLKPRLDYTFPGGLAWKIENYRENPAFWTQISLMSCEAMQQPAEMCQNRTFRRNTQFLWVNLRARLSGQFPWLFCCSGTFAWEYDGKGPFPREGVRHRSGPNKTPRGLF